MINNDTKIANQLKAVMIGHAVGDALGVPVEFCSREELKQKVVADMLENDLEPLCVTGVEDKLQENVRQTLELMRNAGIKVWMLTGLCPITHARAFFRGKSNSGFFPERKFSADDFSEQRRTLLVCFVSGRVVDDAAF